MRNLNIGLKQFKDLLSKIKFRFLFNAKTEIRVKIEPIKILSNHILIKCSSKCFLFNFDYEFETLFF